MQVAIDNLAASNVNNDIHLLSRIKEINWNFEGEKTNFLTHDFHSYPAKFIPQIPKYLIKIFTKEHETIYDPFCGCGTTIVEAILEKRKAVGNDINPLAVLISKVKSTFLSDAQIVNIKTTLSAMQDRLESFYWGSRSFRDLSFLEDLSRIPNLNGWFDQHVINELALIKSAIHDLNDIDIQDFFKVALSSIIVSVSYQDSNTRYVRVNKNIPEKETFQKFKLKVLRMLQKIKELPWRNDKGVVKLLISDTRLPLDFDSNSADLAVTSPPYPNAYDYHLYHKYRMYWLDMNPLDLKRDEIGAHASYSKKNGHTHENFKNDMEQSFIQISRILKPNKYFCIVIGDSIIRGDKIQNNKLLKEMSQATPFQFIYEVKRDIQLSRKSFNPSIGKIKTEYIMFFKNNK
ncbi:MAG: DNA methyltransferase [Candidatus Omnitrophica bacterium]|nr:DNA methyltransferase [Candidatus Omnitrophota bacterium]